MIGRLHDAAFRDPNLAPLVAAIRASAGYEPELSLVAWRPGAPDAPDVPDAPDAPIVGHILLSRSDLVVDDGTRIPILILSPLGVLPADQNRCIGDALTRAALLLADVRAEPLVIVQGHPSYYPRFGFVLGRSIGILPPEHLGAIDKAWMTRRRPGTTPDVRGRVVYPQPFLELDG